MDWYGKVLVGDMLYSNIKGSTITADLLWTDEGYNYFGYKHLS